MTILHHRQIRFMLEPEDFKLMRPFQDKYFAPFTWKRYGKKYELTFTSKGLKDLLFWRFLSDAIFFSKGERRRSFERLDQKFRRLLELSDSLSNACGEAGRRPVNTI